MIGVFDSGVGGLTAYTELRRLLPTADIIYLADRGNAPYGTKPTEELCRLVTEDLRILRALGAKIILMACCTASTVWQLLSDADRAIATPIIQPTAKRAVSESRGHVAVIATTHTAKSHAFRDEIERTAYKMGEKAPPRVTEIATQPLVSLVECGERDGSVTEVGQRIIADVTDGIRELGADTLILGCTHFPHLKDHIRKRLPDTALINPSLEGALEIARTTENRGSGSTVFI